MQNKKILEHRIIYLILCWAFGWIGVHRFYDKKIFSAILYMFTLGFFGIGAFIDLVIGLIAIVKIIFNDDFAN